LQNKKIEIQKKPSLDKYVDIVPSFAEICHSKVNNRIKRKDFIEKMFEYLDLADGLPKNQQ